MNTSKRKYIAGPFVLLLVVAFLAGRWSSDDHAHAENNGEGDVAVIEEREEIWTCSMHPQVRQPEPGDCPICAMALIPVSNDDDPADEDDLPRLSVSPRSAALMNIQTVPARELDVDREVRFVGRIDFDETRLRTIAAWVPGRVDKLYVDHTGATVNQGDPLVLLYSPRLISAQEEFLQSLRVRDSQAGSSTQQAARLVAGARDRLKLLGLSDRQIDELESTREIRDHLTIPAPVGGIVTERMVTEGTYVDTGSPLYSVADLSEVWVQFEAYESDLIWLRQGQSAIFTNQAYPGESFEGVVAFIDPVIDPRKRTARVRVHAANPDGRLKPGMFVRGVVMASPELLYLDGKPPLAIPVSAPLITGRRAVVYVKIPDTERPTFEARDVVLGPRAGDFYSVREGLEKGDLVVTHGNFKIDSELQIRGRPSMMSPPDDEAPGDAVDFRDPPQRHDFAADVPESFGQELQPLVEGYLVMTKALADDDFDTSRKGLKQVHDTLLEIGQHRLDGDAHMQWMEHYDRLHKLTHQAADAKDIDDLRKLLQGMTREVETMALNFGAGQLQVLYRMYCPMVFDDEGATWLQAHDAVENAYFGAMMFRCGESLGVLGEEEER